MRFHSQAAFYVKSLFSKRKLDEQLSEEVRTHVEMTTEGNIAKGMTPEEARYAALREFGNVVQVQERTREERDWVWLEQRLMGLRVSVRQLRKTPGFTLVALATLALGIGINTTAFTVLNRLILFSPPFPQADRLVQIWSTTPGSQTGGIAPADFIDLQDQATSFSHVAFYAINPWRSVTPAGRPAEQVTAMAVGADFFNTIGIPPMLGRNFTAEEEAQSATCVILSYSYWQEHFGGDPAVIGHRLRFFDQDFTIVGVASPTLDDPQIWNARIDFWNLDLAEVNRRKRSWGWYLMIGRLRDDITVAQAEVELKTIASRLAQKHPETNRNRGFHAARYAPDYLGGLGRTLTWMVTALSLTVLLIACLNLASLQLVRATGRAREYAVRLALGASRRQIIESLLLESLLLSFVGGLLGLVVAKWCNDYYAIYFKSPMPLDYRVLAFAFAATTLTGLAFGLLPAWLATRGDVDVVLKQGGRTTTAGRSRLRLRQLLIVSELVLTLALLASAGFFVRGIQRIMDRSLHWNPNNVLFGSFELGNYKYGDTPNPRHVIFAGKFLAALRELPGVEQAAFSTAFPATGPNGTTMLAPPDGEAVTPNSEAVANYDSVTPEFFATYGIPLLRGRTFTDRDRPGTPPVVVISASLAEKYWPGQDPVGKRLRYNQAGYGEEIVGVVGDFTYGADFMNRYPPHHFYRSWLQHSNRFPSFSLRTSGDPRLLREKIREVLSGMEPDVAIARLLTAREGLESNVASFALVRRTLMYLAGLGLLLSMIGIYGLIAHLTAERTQEIGVRLALGAEPHDVVRLFLRSGLVLAGMGTAMGVVLSIGLMRILRHNLDMVPGDDFGTMAAAAIGLFAMAMLASWLPARRAAKVDPVIALRAE